MAFMIDPTEGESANSVARPEVREGKKVLACAGIEFGQTMSGNPKWSTTWVVIRDPQGGDDVGALIWETLPLTQSAAWKIRIIAQAVGQSSSWDAEDHKEMFDVLTKAPILADIVLEPSHSGRTDDAGNIKMDAKVKRWNRLLGAAARLSKDEQEVLEDAQNWYRAWQKKKNGDGGRTVTSRSGGEPPAWDSGGSSGGFAEDDIPF